MCHCHTHRKLLHFKTFSKSLLKRRTFRVVTLLSQVSDMQGQHVVLYTGCPGRNVPDFGRMFLTLKYTDITQNTYIRSLTVTEIMARESSGLLAVPRTVPGSRDVLPVHTTCPSFSLQPGEAYSRCNCTRKVLGTP